MWTAESLVKRKGSPSEEPNPKRTDDACADSSLITQLINNKFIEGLACVLAVDENIVGMAEKLLEGARSSSTLDLDAWKYFTSLPIWQNDKFIQYPKQEHLSQQIQETSDDPSLKPLFAEKEHIRVVLILVILFRGRDVSPTRDGIDSWESIGFFGDLELEGCCAYDKSFDAEHLHMDLQSEGDKKRMEILADELMKHHKIVEIFGELLGTVHSVSPQGALEHFDKVKEVWGNHRFIDHLLKFEYELRPTRAPRISNVRLSVRIRSLIKNDPLFEVISEYHDPDFRMRVALSILIGFWSNEDMIRSLVYTMGGGVKKEQSGEGKEESPRDWMSNTPNIMEFYRDKSIWKLAAQLKEEPEAVRRADFYLETLKLDDCFCSYKRHFNAASLFWDAPSIILKFSETMKKDPKLFEVLTKYSKGAETLRVQERLLRIRKDFQLEQRAIDSFDSHPKMRLALDILLCYWVDRDVTHLFMSLRKVKIKNGFVDLSEDDKIVAFYYYASCATDVEGLKSWLADKYGKGSHEALSLAKKIGEYQIEKFKEARKEARRLGYRDGPIFIQIVLNEASIVDISLCWFGPIHANGQFKEITG